MLTIKINSMLDLVNAIPLLNEPTQFTDGFYEVKESNGRRFACSCVIKNSETQYTAYYVVLREVAFPIDLSPVGAIAKFGDLTEELSGDLDQFFTRAKQQLGVTSDEDVKRIKIVETLSAW